MYTFENDLQAKGYQYIAGCDEVGRGPMAGPVVCAAVILDPNVLIEGLYDSKALSEKKRVGLYHQIKQDALSYAVVFISPAMVDEVNVYQASKQGMTMAVKQLKQDADFVLVDAMELTQLKTPQLNLIKGDQKSASIAAASILAKVERDKYMEEMSVKYPGYGFEKHKGYPTVLHKQKLCDLGPCEIHRKTYKPVKDCLQKQLCLEV